jgi:hypothetical protein
VSTSTSTKPASGLTLDRLQETKRLLDSWVPFRGEPFKIHPDDWEELKAQAPTVARNTMNAWMGVPIIVDPDAPRLPRKRP